MQDRYWWFACSVECSQSAIISEIICCGEDHTLSDEEQVGAEDLPPLCFFHTLRSFHTTLFYQKEAINLHCRCPENEKKVVPEMFISTRGTLVVGNFNGYQTLALRRQQITLTCPLRSTSELCLKAAGTDTCRCFVDKKKIAVPPLSSQSRALQKSWFLLSMAW